MFTFIHVLVHSSRFREASDAHVHRQGDIMSDFHVCVRFSKHQMPMCTDWVTIGLMSMRVWMTCRFVILLSDDRDYFFILYMVYVGVNMLLAGIALLHWPGSEQLELVNNPDGYQVSF